MRVLLNGLQAGNRSGTGRYVEELARALPQADADLDLTLVWPEDVETPPLHPRVRLVRQARRLRNRILFDQVGLAALQKHAEAQVVHYPANFGAMKSLPGLMVTVHDLSYMREPKWYPAHKALYYSLLARQTLRHAARLIADSESTANDLQEFLAIPRERISVVPLGVNPQFRKSEEAAVQLLRETYALPSSYLLFVGTIEPRKNLVRLIEAWSRVAEQVPDLVIAGREGWKIKPVLEAADRSAHRSRLHFPDFIAAQDLPALMSGAHAFVWPSLFEGFGLPPLEAMACGAPVLTSNAASIPEVAGNAALLVDPLDTDAIAEGILRISTDTDLRARLARQGPARAAEFTWARTAEKTLEAYSCL